MSNRTDIYPLNTKLTRWQVAKKKAIEMFAALLGSPGYRVGCIDCGEIGRYSSLSEGEEAVHQHRTKVHGDNKQKDIGGQT